MRSSALSVHVLIDYRITEALFNFSECIFHVQDFYLFRSFYCSISHFCVFVSYFLGLFFFFSLDFTFLWNPQQLHLCWLQISFLLNFLLEYGCFSCVRFCCTISYIYPLYFRFYSHIGHYRGLSTVPCAIHVLVIYFLYIVVYIWQFQSPVLSLLPPPLVTIRLSSVSVTVFLFCKWVHLCLFVFDSTYKWHHMMPVFLWRFTQYDNLWASLIAQLVKNLPVLQETLVQFLGREVCWRRDRLPPPVFLGFPCGSAGKESACNAGDLGLIPGLGRSPGEGKGYLLQYSCLGNSMDCVAHRVAKSQTWLREFHSLTLDNLWVFHVTVVTDFFIIFMYKWSEFFSQWLFYWVSQCSLPPVFWNVGFQGIS